MNRLGTAAGAVLALVALSATGACTNSGEPPSTAPTSTTVTTSTAPASTVPPSTTSGEVPDTVLAATRAAVHSVRGLDCRKAQVGTTFLIAPDLLVTSAHVVAGIEVPILSVGTGEVSSRVVAFDPVSATAGTAVALVAYDGEGMPVERHLTVRQAIRATGEDIYGEPGSGRDALLLDGSVAYGNSGGPIVDGSGTVVGVVFANTRGGEGTSFAVQVGEVHVLLAEVGNSPVPPTECR
jgi:S1-C subfamily serine protease